MEIKLSETLYTAADLQGKPSQASSDELRELGDIARKLEKDAAAAPALLEALEQIANCDLDGEATESGDEYEMTIDDAFQTCGAAVRLARATIAAARGEERKS